MKFELNTDKSTFLTIGPFAFTYAQTLHDVDWEGLDEELKKQFLYNARRGTLKTDEPDKLKDIVEAAPKPAFVPANVVPLQQPQIQEAPDPIEEDLKTLKALLKKSVSTIKKESRDFRVARLRKLLELEEDGKNRKSLVGFLQERLDVHQAGVSKLVGMDDIEGMYADDPEAARSTQVGDIVESEEEQLILSQEVLNQLE